MSFNIVAKRMADKPYLDVMEWYNRREYDAVHSIMSAAHQSRWAVIFRGKYATPYIAPKFH